MWRWPRSTSCGCTDTEPLDAYATTPPANRFCERPVGGRIEPSSGVLRRRIGMIADALGTAAALATGIDALRSAFESLFRPGVACRSWSNRSVP